MAVFVLDKHQKPLMPCSEKRARLLLTRGRARIHSVYPFVIRLVDRTIQESALQPVRCKIDPGSTTTGIAIVREDTSQGVLFLEVFSSKPISLVPSLRGAAAVNSTRNALWDLLTSLPLPCEAATGGQTKYNRHRFDIPKTHALDAACTGIIDTLENWNLPTQQILSSGRGSYQRTRSDRFGFPRGFLLRGNCKTPHLRKIDDFGGRCQSQLAGSCRSDETIPERVGEEERRQRPPKGRFCEGAEFCNCLLRQKKVNGFQTGDQVTAQVLSGKKKGHYVGRVAIRASGSFNIQTADGVIQGINSKYCRRLQRADGYHHLQLTPAPYPERVTTKKQRSGVFSQP